MSIARVPTLSLTLLTLLVTTSLGTACGDKDTPTDDTGAPDGGATDGGATDDTGTTPVEPVWTSVSIETSASITGVYAAAATEAWITMSGGDVRLYQGASWTNLDVEVDDEDLNGLWGSGSGAAATVVAVGDAGHIAQWGSAGWDVEDLGTANFESVDGPSSSDLVAVGWGGLYSNASGDWAYQNIDGNPRFNHVWYEGDVGAAVGEEGVLAIYSGGEWTVTQEEARRNFYGVSGTGVNDIYAVGEGGVVLRWDGSAWTDVSPGTGKSVWAVWAANASNVYIVGNGGLAMVRSNGEWVDLPTGTDKNLYAVHGTGVSDVWAVGGFGVALRYQP